MADAALIDSVSDGVAGSLTFMIVSNAAIVDSVSEGIDATITVRAAVQCAGDLDDTVVESVASIVTIGWPPTVMTLDAALSDLVTETLAAAVLVHNPGDPTMQPGRWIVPVGTRRTPVHIHFDAAQTDDLTFRVGPALLPGESIQVVDVRSEARVGDDAGASGVVVGAYQVSGSDVLQRIRARSLAQVYLIRALVTLNSGRELVGAALLHVVRQA